MPNVNGVIFVWEVLVPNPHDLGLHTSGHVYTQEQDIQDAAIRAKAMFGADKVHGVRLLIDAC